MDPPIVAVAYSVYACQFLSCPPGTWQRPCAQPAPLAGLVLSLRHA